VLSLDVAMWAKQESKGFSAGEQTPAVLRLGRVLLRVVGETGWTEKSGRSRLSSQVWLLARWSVVASSVRAADMEVSGRR